MEGVEVVKDVKKKLPKRGGANFEFLVTSNM